jgi:hypothetical protein
MKIPESELLRIALIIFISFLIVIGLFLICLIEGMIIDNEIAKNYDSEIQPGAQLKISEIVSITIKQDNEIEKVKTISNWTSHFIYPNYPNDAFQLQDRFSHIIMPSPEPHYFKDDHGRWFIRRGKYVEDLNIIAYYETGKCGEIAEIWNYTANLSGFVTRQVGDPSGYHAWVQVQREDGLYYVDPTIPPSDNLVLWFNSTKNRNQSQLIWQAARVMASNQDITHLYPPYGTVKIINFGHYDSLFVHWVDGTGRTYNEPYDTRFQQIIEINLSVKNYSISTTGLWILPIKTNISVKEGKTTEVDLFKELKPVRFQMNKMQIPNIQVSLLIPSPIPIFKK